ncbi:hypothetical protein HTZ77_00960 [Nonomuraea sp. SMC257]|uniref:Uncharacterized protein n=1 Tax=Nonomuraea montanisoli TaxID=2741721 RepID=A0A7Y6I1J6_9ACTN|nr:hypothetical protein [Nonomuraea montanisoli]NUW30007.1 hypothetical protein [Nonomuraea montanisoli]
MHATTDRRRTGRRGVAPLPVGTVQLDWSLDQGQTWSTSGTLQAPTDQLDKATRMLLLTCMTMTGSTGYALWRVSGWPTTEPNGPPTVILHSDGRVP